MLSRSCARGSGRGGGDSSGLAVLLQATQVLAARPVDASSRQSVGGLLLSRRKISLGAAVHGVDNSTAATDGFDALNASLPVMRVPTGQA